jgi:hypothetical protein
MGFETWKARKYVEAQPSYNFLSAVTEYRLQKHGRLKLKNRHQWISELNHASKEYKFKNYEKAFLSSCQVKTKPAVRRPGGRPTIHVSHD